MLNSDLQSAAHIFHDKSLSPKIIQKHKSLLLSVLRGDTTNGANLEKLKNHNIYSIRTNNKGRILFTPYAKDGKNHILVLEILEQHEYDKSRFLKKNVLKKYLEKNMNALEGTIGDAQFQACNDSPVSTDENANENIAPCAVYQSSNSYIQFDENQENVLCGKTPLIIEGPPGSGKTSLGTAFLQQGMAQGLERILYVTESDSLVKHVANQWEQSPDYDPHRVDILRYRNLLAPNINNNEPDVDSEAIFRSWFSKYLKRITDKEAVNFFSEKADLVYQEFRVLSGCPLKEYVSEQGLGQKQSLFSNIIDRKRLSEAFTAWAKYLENEGLRLPEFAQFSEDQHASYDLVIVDESQDLSHMQLLNLSRLCKRGNIIYCLDRKQNLKGEFPNLLFLKKLLPTSRVMPLFTHYRCPENIMKVAKVFDDIRMGLSSSNIKAEHKKSLSTKPDGTVCWVDPDGEGMVRLRELLNDANVCVVAPTKELCSEAKTKLGILQAFTPDQVKGLEYERIILYRPLDTEKMSAVGTLLHAGRVAGENYLCSAELSGCFVASTRATQALYIVQGVKHKTMNICKLLKQAISSLKPAAMIQSKSIQSTPDDWHAKAKELAENELFTQARDILRIKLSIDDSQLDNQLKNWNSKFKSAQNAPLQTPWLSKLPENTLAPVQAAQVPQTKPKHRANPKKGKRKDKAAVSLSAGSIQSSAPPKQEINNAKFAFDKASAVAMSKKISALLKAVYNGDRKKVEKLLKDEHAYIMITGKDIRNGLTVLHQAVLKSRADILELLCRTPGVLIDEKDNFHLSALFYAARNQELDCVRILLREGADCTGVNAPGSTVLHISAMKGADTLKLILKYGKNVNCNAQDSSGFTPLHLAIESESAESVDALLEAGADVSVRDTKFNRTALHFAAIKPRVDLLPLLLDKVKNVDCNVQDCEGLTPLHLAIQANVVQSVEALLRNGADPNLRDKQGRTALHYAAKKGNPHIVCLLLLKGAKVDIRDIAKQDNKTPTLLIEQGVTPLCYAVVCEHVDIVRMLLKVKGVKIDFVAFNKAELLGNKEIIHLFYEALKIQVEGEENPKVNQEAPAFLPSFDSVRKVLDEAVDNDVENEVTVKALASVMRNL